MSGLVLQLKGTLTDRVDASALLTPGWPALDAAALARRPLLHAAAGTVAAGDLFTVTGSAGPLLRLVGDLAQVHRLAEGLQEGTVIVDGHVGARVAAAPPGAKRGMTGGEVIILGNAGPEAGAAMRRGLVAIAGTAGPRAGLGMLAGTVVVRGALGADAGRWAKRGSLVALGDATIPPTYGFACTSQFLVLRVLLTRLRRVHQFPADDAHVDGFYHRYSGDLAEYGKGEILHFVPGGPGT